MGKENDDKAQETAAEATPPEAIDMESAAETTAESTAESTSETVPEGENVFEPSSAQVPASDGEPAAAPEPEPTMGPPPPELEPEPMPETPRETAFASDPPPPPPQVVTEVRKGGFFPMLTGGIMAGLIGLGAGWWLFGQGDDAETVDVAAELATRDDRIAALEAQLSGLSDTTAALEETTGALAEGPDLEPVQSALDDLVTQAGAITEDVGALESELDGTIGGLEARLTDLEQQQTGTDGTLSETATAAYEREIADLREETAIAVEGLTARMDETASAFAALESSLDEDMIALQDSTAAELEAIRAEANAVEEMSEEAAAADAARAAVAEIRSAVESGEPFPDALAALQETGAAEVPGILAETAETGTPTIRALRESFPDMAREALSAVRRADDSVGPASFFERQFNIRSTEPREGDDPDAVLSRAEAAVADGQIAAALDEIAALPDPALEALSAWTAEAETRVGAQSAIDELTATLTAN